jgi:serine/threonine protein kinase
VSPVFSFFFFITARTSTNIPTSYLGGGEDGILLGRASHGDLQTYLDGHPSVDIKQRLLWCRQTAEAIDYVHSHGAVHSDLRPANVLVHETTPGSLDLQLSDFGGSVCQDLKADGLSLPDGPFYSPVFGSDASTLLDLFGMGSLFYTILTGRWPYKSTPGRFAKLDDRLDWEERVVYPNFKMGKFPPVEHLPAGDVIARCWRRKFGTARDVLLALDASFSAGRYFYET